jgi:hypothetical protein
MKKRKIIQVVEYEVKYDTEEGLQRIMEELQEQTIDESAIISNDGRYNITMSRVIDVKVAGVEVKVGHYYKTRGGKEVFIESKIQNITSYRFRGSMEGISRAISWMENGHYLGYEEHEYDLVEEICNEN